MDYCKAAINFFGDTVGKVFDLFYIMYDSMIMTGPHTQEPGTSRRL